MTSPESGICSIEDGFAGSGLAGFFATGRTSPVVRSTITVETSSGSWCSNGAVRSTWCSSASGAARTSRTSLPLRKRRLVGASSTSGVSNATSPASRPRPASSALGWRFILAVGSTSPSVASASGVALPVTRSRRPRMRSGTAATGVAVTTRTPNAASRSRSSAATTGWVAETTGAEASHPIQPPPDCMAAAPSAGRGVPLITCMRPQAARTSAPQPMVTRPVAALSSGLRSTRQARPRSRNGRITSRLPSAPVTSEPTMPPRPVVTFHHTEKATRTASAMKSRPRPSRRWAGSSSLAPRPRVRTAPPTTWPRPTHTAANARVSPVKNRETGEGPEGRAAGRAAGRGLAAG